MLNKNCSPRDVFAQSISALDSCYEKWGRFEILKKGDTQFFVKKQVAKNRVIVIQKGKGSMVFSLFE